MRKIALAASGPLGGQSFASSSLTSEPTESTEESVTQLLRRWSSGDARAFDQLMEQVYEDLHRIATRHLRRERPDHILQPTALLHEVLVRLMQLEDLAWNDQDHFYAVATLMMRRIVVDEARKRGRLKRGGGDALLTLSEAERFATEGRGSDIEALEAALEKLAARDPRKARIVELRFFVGLTGDEIARVLRISTPTVAREWRRARGWLYSELKGEKLGE